MSVHAVRNVFYRVIRYCTSSIVLDRVRPQCLFT